MLWIVLPLLTLCEALVLPVSADCSTATTAAYVFSNFSQVIFIASPTFWSTRSVNLSMFFNLLPTSSVDSFSEPLASALQRMKLSRSLFSTHLLHNSITFTPNSLIPLMAAVDNAVHSGVRCMWQLQQTHLYVFPILGMDVLQVLQILPMISVVIFFLWSVPRKLITRTSQKKNFFDNCGLRRKICLKLLITQIDFRLWFFLLCFWDGLCFFLMIVFRLLPCFQVATKQ